jgi:small-conductance mechanosensitive channel
LRAEANTADDAPAQTGLAAITLFAWGIAGVALLALAAGYIGFSLSVGQMAAWTLVLGAAVYIVLVAIDDVATSVFERGSRLGQALTRGLGLRGGTVDQFGVLLSGVLRVLLAVLALALWLLPLGGSGVADMFTRLGDLARGVQVGGVTISPGAILRSVAVLAIGLTLVRAFMRWLEGRYLPATDLDGSGRNSVSLVARYVGIALAVIWALASLGIGIERIALLLSALSVGIGFGLQAITQNFVSGLILLAERPIKIGDLIRVGTDEGDVKRISVRSTEITLADHSTLIVPNSELITKSVLNKTLASPLGRIQIQFSVPLGTDAARVRALVLEAFAREEAVLADPAPSAFIDAITDGKIAFNCFAHVASPRAAYGARSNILLELLTRFRDEGIEMGTVPQRLELVTTPGDPVPPLPAAPEGGTARG